MPEASYSRTRNSLRNSIIALSIQFAAMIIGFFSRKVFLNCLGTEVLGLNSTANSLLGFLNIAELGIGSSVAVTLYKPLFEKNYKKISEIVALQGWLYRIVALVVIVGSAVMMCFFPRIFSRTELPLWYAYASFSTFLFSSLLGYFVNYKMIVLEADQKNYKIQLSTRIFGMVRLLLQMFAVKYLENGYVWWLVIEALNAIVCAWALRKTVNRTYPFLKEKEPMPRRFVRKYPEVTSKVKLVFVHQLGSMLQNNLSNILIYTYVSLSMVALYGNYMLLVTNLTTILASFFAGLTASIGNMVAEGDKKLIMKIFRELFTSRFLMVSVCCICLWILSNPFIEVWLGPEFLLGRITLLIIIAQFFITTMKSVVENYLFAYGMFQDIWAPIAQVALTVVISILLGKAYGMNGVLLGALAAQVLIYFIWKPIFLFVKGLKEPLSIYVKIYAKHLLVFAVSFVLTILVSKLISIDPASGLLQFFIYAVMIFLFSTAVTFALLYATERGMRDFVGRMRAVLLPEKTSNLN